MRAIFVLAISCIVLGLDTKTENGTKTSSNNSPTPKDQQAPSLISYEIHKSVSPKEESESTVVMETQMYDPSVTPVETNVEVRVGSHEVMASGTNQGPALYEVHQEMIPLEIHQHVTPEAQQHQPSSETLQHQPSTGIHQHIRPYTHRYLTSTQSYQHMTSSDTHHKTTPETHQRPTSKQTDQHPTSSETHHDTTPETHQHTTPYETHHKTTPETHQHTTSSETHYETAPETHQHPSPSPESDPETAKNNHVKQGADTYPQTYPETQTDAVSATATSFQTFKGKDRRQGQGQKEDQGLKQGQDLGQKEDLGLKQGQDLGQKQDQGQRQDQGQKPGQEGLTSWHSTLSTSGMDEDLSHECIRDCRLSNTNKKCYYKFKVEWFVSMNKDCLDCPHNGRDCLRPHCVPTDGQARPIVTVNHRVPGPSIQVCEGDEIVVDVKNELDTDSTSIHWHGLHQIGTPFMDGVPFLTQCPISPGSTFRYHFLADLPGTHYWHSHTGFQRTDGVFGSLVIRPQEDPHAPLFDVDDPRHLMVLTDWLPRVGIDKFDLRGDPHGNMPYNLLVNGLGKYKPLEKEGNFSHTPLYEYRVAQGLRYRFRSLSNSIQSCPIEISIDNHTLLAIASDAHNIQPIEVESLVIYAGERWDIVVTANQPPGVYWVKFTGRLYCDERFKSAHQVALLRYEGVSGGPNTPPEDIDYHSTKRGGKQINKVNEAPGDRETFFTSADIRAYRNDAKEVNTTDEGTSDVNEKYSREPDHTFWFDLHNYVTDNFLFQHEEFHPLLYQIPRKTRLYIFQVNGITFKKTNVPPLSQPEDVDEAVVCNGTSKSSCKESFCCCTHILNVELGSLVELILVDTSDELWANHPFHLHGYAFAVMGTEKLGDETTLEAVKRRERQGLLQRNFVDPPIKDTVTVPDGGYTIIRFVADNPGYWLFHCHVAFHAETGMSLVIHVGEQKHLPVIPKGFPKCGSWKPTLPNPLKQEVSKWKDSNVDIHLSSSMKGVDYVPYDTRDSAHLGVK